jgi:hypothetical protein
VPLALVIRRMQMVLKVILYQYCNTRNTLLTDCYKATCVYALVVVTDSIFLFSMVYVGSIGACEVECCFSNGDVGN